MPKKVCGFGFDCASMLLKPGLDPGKCPNYHTCGSASRLTPDEEIEFVRVRQVQLEEHQRQQRERQQQYEHPQEVWRTTRRQLAIELLLRRGCPQQVQDYLPDHILQQLREAIAQLQQQLTQFEGSYIPPEGCIAHRYWVNRGYARYPYNKLMAPAAVFPAVEREEREWTRVIHLSRDDDPRNQEARKGMTRMHRLLAIREQLQLAQTALAEAIALAEAEVEPFWAQASEVGG